jgi:hypothetical protein
MPSKDALEAAAAAAAAATASVKRVQKCKKCGLPRRGHVCLIKDESAPFLGPSPGMLDRLLDPFATAEIDAIHANSLLFQTVEPNSMMGMSQEELSAQIDAADRVNIDETIEQFASQLDHARKHVTFLEKQMVKLHAIKEKQRC